MQQKKISVVIPCYNEEEGIPALAEKLAPAVRKLEQQYATEIILVDDGSRDHTYELLQQHFGQQKNHVILRHEQNKNLGAALRTGFAHATGDYIAALDSDCTYHPDLLVTMMGLMDPQTNIVTVSPYHPQGKVNNVPAYRIFLSKSVSRIYKILLGSPVYTYTAMVRIYTKDVVKSTPFTSNTFLGVTELMIRSILKGYTVKELPAELNVRQFGASKMKTLKVIGDHLGLISKITAHRIFKTQL